MTTWNCIYSEETWAQRRPGEANWKQVDKLLSRLDVGDTVVVYVIGYGWVGRWVARSRARLDVEASPFGATYPVICSVDDRITVALEQAIPTGSAPNPSPLLQPSGQPVPYLAMAAGIELKSDVAEALLELLSGLEVGDPQDVSHRTRRASDGVRSSAQPVTPRPEARTGSSTAPSDRSGPVVRADAESSVDRSVVGDHAASQRRLLSLGRQLGFTPWVTPDDKSKPADDSGQPLAELPDVTTVLPQHLDIATASTIRHIDVMWLKGSAIVAAFEVENSTSIYSGLLRMADLLAIQPNLTIPLYLVVPPKRLGKALKELRRPVFEAMKTPLSQVCGVLSYEDLEALEALAEQAHGHLDPKVLRNYASWASSVVD